MLPRFHLLFGCLLMPSNMYSHFAAFRLCLFCHSQSIAPFDFSLSSWNSCRGSLLLKEIPVSSENVFGYHFDRDLSKSFVNTMNKRSPIHDPCGIPQVTTCFLIKTMIESACVDKPNALFFFAWSPHISNRSQGCHESVSPVHMTNGKGSLEKLHFWDRFQNDPFLWAKAPATCERDPKADKK